MSAAKPGNPLVNQPWLYDFIYPEASGEAAAMCERIIEQHIPGSGLKILDVGCGTGKVLAALAQHGHEGIGIDASVPMIDYAALIHPELRIQVGDMRDFDLDEEFDVVMCVGSTFTNNLSNADVHSTIRNLRKHCKSGGLLILGVLNASRFLGAETFNERVEMRVDEGEFHATAFSRHLLDRRGQSFRRVRTWRIDGQDDPVIDDAEFRLFFPLELEDYLAQQHFSVVGIWDNKELKESTLSGRRLYIAARPI